MYNNVEHNSLDFLKVLEKFTFESKMSLSQKYSTEIMSCSQVDMYRAWYEGIFPWEIDMFVACSIIYDSDDATDILDYKTFADIITLIRNYEHSGLADAEERGEYSETFIMISVLQQSSVEGPLLRKLYRFNYFFTFQNEKVDMRKVFLDKMGVEYERLDKFALLVFLGFSKEAQEMISPTRKQNFLNSAYKDKDVLHLLTIEKEKYREKFLLLYKGDIIDQYYGLKIQYLYPFISEKDCTYIPSPYLVINAVTESMLNRITEGDKNLRRLIGKEVIESYLYDIVAQLDTVTWISKEISYKNGRNEMLTSDVIAAEGDTVIFYDTKAITPSLKLRKFDTNEIERETDIYAENVIKVYNQIENYLKGLFQLNDSYLKSNLFGIVVVLEDAVVYREKVYKKVYDILQENVILSEEEKHFICSHIKVLSLRNIECMILNNSSLIPELKKQLGEPKKWYDYQYIKLTTENGRIPSYAHYIQDIKDRAQKSLKESPIAL